MLYKLLRKLGLKFLPAGIVAMGVTFLYGIMTGLSFSTIRAIVMLGLSIGGEVIGRKYDILTGMALALGILLMVEPCRIYDGGLILSFGAISGVVVGKYVIKLLERKKNFLKIKKKKRRLYGFLSTLIFSNCINLVTAPFIAYFYFQIPTYSVIINMITVPLMSVTVFCGFFGILISYISPVLGHLVIYPAALTINFYDFICQAFQKFPLGILNTGKPIIIEIVVYYLILAVVLVVVNPKFISRLRSDIHRKTKKWWRYERLRNILAVVAGTVVFAGVMSIVIIREFRDEEKVIFLDVGQGDGILIRSENGTNMVIDSGSSSNGNLGEYVVSPALLAEGMGKVDYWFISHFDTDHTSGLKYILELDLNVGIDIENLVVGCNAGEEPLIELAKKKGINVIYMKSGDCISDGSFTIKAIHPGEKFQVDDKNEQSLVLDYSSPRVSILFAGDIGGAAIESMLDTPGWYGGYDIYKVAHHGSKYSVSQEFIGQITPRVSVISCGEKNMYGHPHKETLEMLENSETVVLTTPDTGAITVKGEALY